MSLFTAPSDVGKPPCLRCHTPQFVELVSKGKELSVWDCKKCGAVPPHKPEPVRQPRRRK